GDFGLEGRVASAVEDLAGVDFGDLGHVGLCGSQDWDSRKPLRLVTWSIAISVSSSARIWPSGQALGPSDKASAGFGWVSMKMPEMPTAIAARDSTGTNSRWPPLLPPAPPGSCTLWVASNTTGQPVSRITARLRMSLTRLL